MDQLHLRAVSRTQGNNRALKAGEVTPRGYVLDFEEVPVLVQAFRRMVRTLEFDVCEMAVTTYLTAKAHGVAFTAVPVFLVRGFHHGAIVRPADREDLRPKDLTGRRVGVNRGYTVTTGVWAREILRAEHGLDLDAVTWVPSGDEHVEAYVPPPNVRPAPGLDLPAAVADGELAAAVGVEADKPELAPLIPDAAEAGYAALAARGHYPVNHLVVVRDDLLAAHDDLAADLFEAFAESKRRYVEALDTLPEPTAVDRMHRRVREITGADPLPYGLEPNRAVLEELARAAVDQHILAQPPDLDAMFAPGTRELVG
ncbi:MAG TPA: ABC transporter substrate-binding protein [Mycobacteriales bacterium]|jgi:4,5-dihydroxyphthalate decarboxylase|nr:ABC transporter substrate-binding protein [Mycobacteriales bacterium]